MPNKNMRIMKLYLCEKEEQDDDYLYRLDLYISLDPGYRDIRKILFVDERVICGLSNLIGEVIARKSSHLTDEGTELFKELYRLFGITDLKDKVGLPKGPYYHVDNDVYGAVANEPIKVNELSKIVINLKRGKMASLDELK